MKYRIRTIIGLTLMLVVLLVSVGCGNSTTTPAMFFRHLLLEMSRFLRLCRGLIYRHIQNKPMKYMQRLAKSLQLGCLQRCKLTSENRMTRVLSMKKMTKWSHIRLAPSICMELSGLCSRQLKKGSPTCISIIR